MGRLRTVAGVLLLVLLSVPWAAAQKGAPRQPLTVTGTLVRVAGIGGETTGWAIQLDSPIEVQGERLETLEVSGKGGEFARLENRHVRASGVVASRRGVTRGEWRVLEVRSIREWNRKP